MHQRILQQLSSNTCITERNSMAAAVASIPLLFEESRKKTELPLGCSSTKRHHYKKRPLFGKKVGFTNESSFTTIVLDSLNEEEYSKKWYTSKDYKLFAKNAKKTVRHILKGKIYEGLTGRGLEKYFSRQYNEEKKRREVSHYGSIFIEQQQQQMQGRRNPKILRMLSTVNSKWALNKAIDLGRHDYDEVLRIHNKFGEAEKDGESDTESTSSCTKLEVSMKFSDMMSTSSIDHFRK